MKVRALAGWFGSNRMLAHHVGAALRGLPWIGVPFLGGASEIAEMENARTIVCNDLHRQVINLSRCVKDDYLRARLIRRLRRTLFHPDVLAESQEICKSSQPGDTPDLDLAEHYFVCCWMGRGGKAGTDDEFNGRPSIRWKSDGGDSVVRYWSALRSLAEWGRTFRRCSFETMDAFDFITRCEDNKECGIYCDPPFPGAGRRYKHNAGQTDDEEIAWHTKLWEALSRFKQTRVVMRFYDHPLIREFYGTDEWLYVPLVGRKQSNDSASELLLIRNPGNGTGMFEFNEE